MLSEARIVQSEGLVLPAKEATRLIPYDITSYSPEEREELKKRERKGFAGLSRRNELLWVSGKYGKLFVLKYPPLKEH
jgi:hypothetical protein